MASFGFMVIRGLFAVAEHVSPAATGTAAFHLFSRVPRPGKVSDKERAALAKAEPIMREGRRHRLNLDRGGWVTAYDFASPQGRRAPTVLVLHGWRSRAAHMSGIIAGLVQGGFRVIALDLPGHGESGGRHLNMANAVAAVHAADQWFGPFSAIVGHSFGGAVAANAIVGSVNGIPAVAAGRLVTVAAPSSMPAVFREFGRFLNLGTRAQTALAARVLKVTGRPLEEFVVARQLADHPLPALVVHAPDDKEVSASEAESMATAGPHVQLHWAPGLGHRRILADCDVTRRIVDFLTDPEVAVAGRAVA
ncbi:MAG: alpha/beta fold hydrolase [Brucellaceae bacterium]|nr:alpha/beta fold hydrolase [Brucellaceae bacterium]